MSVFLLCFAAWAAIALGMDRHHADAMGREGSAQHLQRLRRAGWLLLALSLWQATRTPGDAPASLGIATWAVALSIAALAVTATATWQARHLPRLATAALASAVAAWAAGW